ncbi:hypothetical protein O0L34_g19455 [Tuta absoluta]|nr:hypothetical protein O0L34_g19455 [Tuta absoluta]
MLSRFHPNNTELKTFILSHVCKHKGILKHSRIEYLNSLLSTTSDGGSGRALWGVIRSETNNSMEVSEDPFAVLRHVVFGDVAGAGLPTHSTTTTCLWSATLPCARPFLMPSLCWRPLSHG